MDEFMIGGSSPVADSPPQSQARDHEHDIISIPDSVPVSDSPFSQWGKRRRRRGRSTAESTTHETTTFASAHETHRTADAASDDDDGHKSVAKGILDSIAFTTVSRASAIHTRTMA
jgi:hypothetical protein